ncbi:Gamma-Aminobutyric Acid Receptor Subunit Rho-3 [Manis pentadactyla]|nr:Gamma-Aminobutyric Acid Receptor Subunit Rho-3 [Manis pentadactyla]
MCVKVRGDQTEMSRGCGGERAQLQPGRMDYVGQLAKSVHSQVNSFFPVIVNIEIPEINYYQPKHLPKKIEETGLIASWEEQTPTQAMKYDYIKLARQKTETTGKQKSRDNFSIRGALLGCTCLHTHMRESEQAVLETNRICGCLSEAFVNLISTASVKYQPHFRNVYEVELIGLDKEMKEKSSK